MSDDMKAMFKAAWDTHYDSALGQDYDERHGVQAAPVLTIMEDEHAALAVEWIEEKIAGKTVVEIGGGIGLLSCHMGHIAKRVFCIEANPVWTSSFLATVYAGKPKNVSFIYGAAEEFVGLIKADVAVICTHSGLEAMREVAAKFAPAVIDLWGEIIAQNPEAFDAFAREARKFA